MPKTKVYVIKQKPKETVQDVVIRTLKSIPMKNYITNSEKRILINPNWVCSDHSDSGNVTSTETLEGIILYLLNEVMINPEKIIVADGGESGSSSYESVLKNNNISILEDYGIEVLDLNSDTMIENIKVSEPLALKTVNIAKTAMDASCIISVPSLKTHSMAVTTLSMKNMMGTILPKGIMHSSLHKKIADLTSVLREKMKFQIIDGIIGSNGFELGGSPVKMDLIIAGEDPVAVDTIGSKIIGYDHNTVKYLSYAEKKGLGTADLENIEIIGKQIEEVYHKF